MLTARLRGWFGILAAAFLISGSAPALAAATAVAPSGPSVTAGATGAGRVVSQSGNLVSPNYTSTCGTVTFLLGATANVGQPDSGQIQTQSTQGWIAGGSWSISWGDGTSSSGSIPFAFSGTWSTSVSHTYTAAGYFDATLSGTVYTLSGSRCTIIPITDTVSVL